MMVCISATVNDGRLVSVKALRFCAAIFYVWRVVFTDVSIQLKELVMIRWQIGHFLFNSFAQCGGFVLLLSILWIYIVSCGFWSSLTRSCHLSCLIKYFLMGESWILWPYGISWISLDKEENGRHTSV